MNRVSWTCIRKGVILLCGAGASLALPACASDRSGPMLPAEQVTTTSAVDEDLAFALSEDLTVDVRVWLSEPLQAPDERGQVRVVVAEADFNLNHLWVAKSLFWGPIQSSSAEPIDLGRDGINIGLAKFMAAQILGESETHPYVRELTRPCDVSVKPRGDRTWGDVAAAGNVDIPASMHE